jgi:hypothetical protein
MWGDRLVPNQEIIFTSLQLTEQETAVPEEARLLNQLIDMVCIFIITISE